MPTEPPGTAAPVQPVAVMPQPDPPSSCEPTSWSAWLRGKHVRSPAADIFFWVTACLGWTFLLPCLLAWLGGVLTAPQVEAEVRRKPAYAACGGPLCAAEDACDMSVPVARFFAAAPNTERPRIAFFGFIESRTTYCYFLASLALGLLVWRYRKPRPPYRDLSWGAGLGIWAVWGGLSLLRAWPQADASRTIFSFVHWDVSKIEFFLQEVRSYLLCVLVASIWRHAEIRGRKWARRWAAVLGTNATFNPEHLNRCADTLGERVQRWHVDSLLLGLAFLPWTLYYWSLDRRWGDPRYYMSTLVWHIVWGICWWVLSRPTFSAWHEFGRHRARVRAALLAPMRSKSTENLDASLQWLDGLKPVSTMRFAIIGAASIVTFFLPLLKAFH
jgi:hypothetical protein